MHPAHCDPLNFFGTYLVTFRHVSGTCATPVSGLVRVGENVVGSGSCTEAAPTRLREGDCVWEESLNCVTSTGTPYSEVGVYVINDEAASRVTGTVTLSLANCTGTFDVTFERQ